MKNKKETANIQGNQEGQKRAEERKKSQFSYSFFHY